MSSSFLTLLPAVEIGRVTYCPLPVPADPTEPPRVRIDLGADGAGLSLTVADSEVLFTRLGEALAEHRRAVSAQVVLMKGVA